ARCVPCVTAQHGPRQPGCSWRTALDGVGPDLENREGIHAATDGAPKAVDRALRIGAERFGDQPPGRERVEGIVCRVDGVEERSEQPCLPGVGDLMTWHDIACGD